MLQAMQCPWCKRWCLKDSNCSYIFSCGLDEKNKFIIGAGCGKSWCWTCGKKYCGCMYNPETGIMNSSTHQHGICCEQSTDFCPMQYCLGGHSSHCAVRSFTLSGHEQCTLMHCAKK
jgi:hypothetical protein